MNQVLYVVKLRYKIEKFLGKPNIDAVKAAVKVETDKELQARLKIRMEQLLKLQLGNQPNKPGLEKIVEKAVQEDLKLMNVEKSSSQQKDKSAVQVDKSTVQQKRISTGVSQTFVWVPAIGFLAAGFVCIKCLLSFRKRRNINHYSALLVPEL